MNHQEYQELIDEIKQLKAHDAKLANERLANERNERINKIEKIAKFIIDKWRYQNETATVIAVSEAEDVLFLVAEVRRLNGVEQ